MLRISAGLAIFLATLGTVGCGTAQVPHPGSGAHPAVPARMKSQGPPPGISTALPAGAGSSSGCQNSAPAGPVARTLVITLVGNGKTYCARVGDTLRVALRGTGSSQWLRPLVSGDAVVPVPGAATDEGVTGASFAAVRPGRVIMTSVRPPCRVAVPSAKDELEPGFPLPKVYPLRFCAPGHRFSALVIVRR
jgi:hypothetical protein